LFVTLKYHLKSHSTYVLGMTPREIKPWAVRSGHGLTVTPKVHQILPSGSTLGVTCLGLGSNLTSFELSLRQEGFEPGPSSQASQRLELSKSSLSQIVRAGLSPASSPAWQPCLRQIGNVNRSEGKVLNCPFWYAAKSSTGTSV
jgi:hypothetical protein